MSKPDPRKIPRRRGAAVVELAIVLPLLLAMMVGVWEVGRLVDARQLLDNAVREAARKAAAGKQSQAEVQQAVFDVLQRAGIDTTGMPAPTLENITDSTRAEPPDAEQMDHYRVTAQMPAANFNWSPVNLFVSSSTVITVSVDFYSMNDSELTIDTAIPSL